MADRVDEIDNARINRLTMAVDRVGWNSGDHLRWRGIGRRASADGDAADMAGDLLASWFGVSAVLTHSEAKFRHDRNAFK